ncbi:MAG: hypothetical protein JWR60_3821 [Polaromonas sp.]|nr:hypothetical protein [Polaromonas sp.]
MHGLNKSARLAKSPFHALVREPRFLRAMASLLVLTTGIVWAASSSHAGGLVLDSALRNGMGLNIAAGPALGAGVGSSVGAGVGSNAGGSAGTGANVGSVRGNVAPEQPLPYTGRTADDANGQGAGAGSPSAAGRTAGSVRSMGNGAGTGMQGGGGALIDGRSGAAPQTGSAVGAGARAVIPTR